MVLDLYTSSSSVLGDLRSRPIGVLGTLLAASARLLPHPPNATPVAAMCLYAGARVPSSAGFLLAAAALAVSDLLIGVLQINAPWNEAHRFVAFGWWTAFGYTAFAVDWLIGRKCLADSTNLIKINAVAVFSSLQFFVISNLGVWAAGGLYPRTWSGMLACFEAGIPFIGWQILADCAFTTVWFVAHFVVTSYVQRFRSEKVGVAHAQTTFSNHASSVAGPSVQEDVHLLKDASSATDMDNSLPYSP